MSEPINEPPVAGGAEGDVALNDVSPQQDEIKLNPAWNPLLEKIPDQNLQKLIMPTLKEWDQNYNQGIQKVHSQYAAFKPFLDAQVPPEDLNNAMMVYQALQEDPQKVIEALMEWSGYEGAPSEQGPEDSDEEDPEYDAGDGEAPFDITQHPDFQRYGQMTELMAQQLLAANEEKVKAKEDADLDKELAEAKAEFGEFEEDIVLPIMHAYNLSAKEAVQRYQEHTQKAIQSYRSPGSRAPILAGGSGGVPSQQTPVKGLDGQGRRKLVAEMLAKAQQEG